MSLEINDDVLTKFRGADSYAMIPAGVTSIGKGAFQNHKSLKSVSMPAGVICIGDNAFRDCRGLTDVTIPETVTSIGDGAFEDCRKLMNVKIPDGITYIGKGAFGGCRSLTNITIPQNVTCIKCGAFMECFNLTSVIIPESVTSIGLSAFLGCKSLTSVEIPDSVVSIEGFAFSGCKGLTSVIIGKGVMHIKEYAFSDCEKLTEAIIPDSVTTIDKFAFSGCKRLKNVTISKLVTSIGDYAFKDCKGLKSITIPEGLTRIEEGTFENCTSLTSVTLSKSLTSIGDRAFAGCDKLKTVTILDSAYNEEKLGELKKHLPETTIIKWKGKGSIARKLRASANCIPPATINGNKNVSNGNEKKTGKMTARYNDVVQFDLPAGYIFEDGVDEDGDRSVCIHIKNNVGGDGWDARAVEAADDEDEASETTCFVSIVKSDAPDQELFDSIENDVQDSSTKIRIHGDPEALLAITYMDMRILSINFRTSVYRLLIRLSRTEALQLRLTNTSTEEESTLYGDLKTITGLWRCVRIDGKPVDLGEADTPQGFVEYLSELSENEEKPKKKKASAPRSSSTGSKKASHSASSSTAPVLSGKTIRFGGTVTFELKDGCECSRSYTANGKPFFEIEYGQTSGAIGYMDAMDMRPYEIKPGETGIETIHRLGWDKGGWIRWIDSPVTEVHMRTSQMALTNVFSICLNIQTDDNPNPIQAHVISGWYDDDMAFNQRAYDLLIEMISMVRVNGKPLPDHGLTGKRLMSLLKPNFYGKTIGQIKLASETSKRVSTASGEQKFSREAGVSQSRDRKEAERKAAEARKAAEREQRRREAEESQARDRKEAERKAAEARKAAEREQRRRETEERKAAEAQKVQERLRINKEITSLRAEMNDLRGLFAGMKRKKLQKQIDELNEQLRRL